MMLARGGGICLALACSVPWSARTVGFAGVSDRRRDLAERLACAACTNVPTEARSRSPGRSMWTSAMGGSCSPWASEPTPDEAAREALGRSRAEPGGGAAASYIGHGVPGKTALDVPRDVKTRQAPIRRESGQPCCVPIWPEVPREPLSRA